MGELSNCVQSVQHEKRGQDPRRSSYASKIERLICLYLLENRLTKDIEILSDAELEFWGIDSCLFKLIFPNYKRVVVYEDWVLVEFNLAK